MGYEQSPYNFLSKLEQWRGKGGIINNYARNTSINQDIWSPQLSVGSYTHRNVSQRMPEAEIGARILGKDLRVKSKGEINGSQSGATLVLREHLATSEDMFTCHNSGVCCSYQPVGKNQGCQATVPEARDSPSQQSRPTHAGKSAKVENPYVKNEKLCRHKHTKHLHFK